MRASVILDFSFSNPKTLVSSLNFLKHNPKNVLVFFRSSCVTIVESMVLTPYQNVAGVRYYRAISTVRDQKNKKFFSEGRVIESLGIYLILCFREIPTVRTPTANNQP
jgi:hypothetical protein